MREGINAEYKSRYKKMITLAAVLVILYLVLFTELGTLVAALLFLTLRFVFGLALLSIVGLALLM